MIAGRLDNGHPPFKDSSNTHTHTRPYVYLPALTIASQLAAAGGRKMVSFFPGFLVILLASSVQYLNSLEKKSRKVAFPFAGSLCIIAMVYTRTKSRPFLRLAEGTRLRTKKVFPAVATRMSFISLAYHFIGPEKFYPCNEVRRSLNSLGFRLQIGSSQKKKKTFSLE